MDVNPSKVVLPMRRVKNSAARSHPRPRRQQSGQRIRLPPGVLVRCRSASGIYAVRRETLVAATGHFEGTALNSDRQLWSVAAKLDASYRVLFGMHLQPDRLAFRPMVPPAYDGEVNTALLDQLRLTPLESG